MDNNTNGVALLQIFIDDALLNAEPSEEEFFKDGFLRSQLDQIPYDELQQVRGNHYYQEEENEEQESMHQPPRTRVSPIYSPNSSGCQSDTVTYERHIMHKYSNSVGDMPGVDGKHEIEDYIPRMFIPQPSPQVILQGQTSRSQSQHPQSIEDPEEACALTTSQEMTSVNDEFKQQEEDSQRMTPDSPHIDQSDFAKGIVESPLQSNFYRSGVFEIEDAPNLMLRRPSAFGSVLQVEPESSSIIESGVNEDANYDYAELNTVQEDAGEQYSGSVEEEDLTLSQQSNEQPDTEEQQFTEGKEELWQENQGHKSQKEEIKVPVIEVKSSPRTNASIKASPQPFNHQAAAHAYSLSPQRKLNFEVLFTESIIPDSPSARETRIFKPLLLSYSSQSKPLVTSPLQESSPKYPSFINRMKESEVKRKLKLDYLRQEKQLQELSHVKQSPTISPKSAELIQHKLPFKRIDFYQTQMLYAREQKMKAEQLRLEQEYLLQRQLTGQPQLTDMARNIPKRGVGVLLEWKEQTKLKKEQRFREESRRHLEIIDQHMSRCGKYLNKGSRKYLGQKAETGENVEERLLRFGEYINQKKEHIQQKQLQTQIYLANKLHQKRAGQNKCKPKTDGNKENESYLRTLSPSELSKLQSSKSRQVFYTKYLTQKASGKNIFATVQNPTQQQMFISFGRPVVPVNFNTFITSSRESSGSKDYVSPSSQQMPSTQESPPRQQMLNFNDVTQSPQNLDYSHASSRIALNLYQKIRYDAQYTPQLETESSEQVQRGRRQVSDPYGWNIPHLPHLDLSLSLLDPSSNASDRGDSRSLSQNQRSKQTPLEQVKEESFTVSKFEQTFSEQPKSTIKLHQMSNGLKVMNQNSGQSASPKRSQAKSTPTKSISKYPYLAKLSPDNKKYSPVRQMMFEQSQKKLQISQQLKVKQPVTRQNEDSSQNLLVPLANYSSFGKAQEKNALKQAGPQIYERCKMWERNRKVRLDQQRAYYLHQQQI